MKRVLIITYYWPPSGGITVLRCLKIAKYLRQYGWEPIIYTAENAHYPFIDHSNDKDIPADIEIIKGKIWEPYGLYKKFTGQKSDTNVNNVFYTTEEKTGLKHKLAVWIRSNFFIPDARAKWIPPSVKVLSEYLKKHKIDAILSNGPPHSNTRIATIISKKYGIPWLADFQDPWTQVDYFKMLNLTSKGRAKHIKMEQEALEQSSAITIVSKSWKKDIEALGAQNVSVIPWGFDPDDYPDQANTEVEKYFGFTHVGIMGHDRNPVNFLNVLKTLCIEDPIFSSQLKLTLLGQVDHNVVNEISAHGLNEQTDYLGTAPRKDALSITISSPILLLLLNQQENAEGRIPGKLFEYLASKRPILALGPIQSDVKDIIESSHAGYYCAYKDSQAIKQVIKKLFGLHRSGKLTDPINSNINKYSIVNTTKSIADILNKIS